LKVFKNVFEQNHKDTRYTKKHEGNIQRLAGNSYELFLK